MDTNVEALSGGELFAAVGGCSCTCSGKDQGHSATSGILNKVSDKTLAVAGDIAVGVAILATAVMLVP
jgi:hypothetical protein